MKHECHLTVSLQSKPKYLDLYCFYSNQSDPIHKPKVDQTLNFTLHNMVELFETVFGSSWNFTQKLAELESAIH